MSRPGLILQHSPDGPPARLGAWLKDRGIPFVLHPMWDRQAPDPSDYAFVVSLGSERSAADTDAWVPGAIETLRAAVAADVPVLGLCFGGQALSLALGGGIEVLGTPEIGWLAVDGDEKEIPSGPWLQYHFDLMQVPPGGRELARSPAGVAAFRHGRHLGLQFHPEADAAVLASWARTDPKLPATGITPEQLDAQSARHADDALLQAFALFDHWRETSLEF
ncbi:MAG: aminotransferase [Actinomycetota bacterium]|nr:aminotransferase [Actinomycetota bacterium]